MSPRQCPICKGGIRWGWIGIRLENQNLAWNLFVSDFLGRKDRRTDGCNLSGLKHGKPFFRKPISSDDFFAAQILPYETLGAPQVGKSAEADEWILSQYETAPNKPASADEWLSSFQDYYVVQLVKENEGLPIYSNWAAGNQ